MELPQERRHLLYTQAIEANDCDILEKVGLLEGLVF